MTVVSSEGEPEHVVPLTADLLVLTSVSVLEDVENADMYLFSVLEHVLCLEGPDCPIAVPLLLMA